MPRTPLAGTLQQIAAQVSVDAGTAPRPTRRQLLAGGAGVAAAAAASRFAPRRPRRGRRRGSSSSVPGWPG